jgi:hypothetical protein
LLGKAETGSKRKGEEEEIFLKACLKLKKKRRGRGRRERKGRAVMEKEREKRKHLESLPQGREEEEEGV